MRSMYKMGAAEAQDNPASPNRDSTWPMAGLGHEEVVPSVLNGRHQRSLLNQRMIQMARRSEKFRSLFVEDELPAELRELA